MVGHTGYLIFARKIEEKEIEDEELPPVSDTGDSDNGPL
jgi:hypothetical protein